MQICSITIFYILILIGCLIERNSARTNQNSSIDRRIVRGRDSEQDWPFYVALILDHVKNKLHCGATMIHKQYILTAAHCLHPFDNRPRHGNYAQLWSFPKCKR